MTLFRLRLFGSDDTIQEERWISAASQKEAKGVGRESVKGRQELFGFELWREDRFIYAEKLTGRKK